VKRDSARAAVPARGEGQPPRADAPRLAPGVRLGHDGATFGENFWLAVPRLAGRVRLNASAAAILLRCDGSRNLDGLVADLERHFGACGIRPEVVEFLQRARERGWIA